MNQNNLNNLRLAQFICLTTVTVVNKKGNIRRQIVRVKRILDKLTETK